MGMIQDAKIIYKEPKKIHHPYLDWYLQKILVETINNPPKPKSLLELLIPEQQVWNVVVYNGFKSQSISYPLISMFPSFTPFEQQIPCILNRNLKQVDDISRYVQSSLPVFSLDYNSRPVDVVLIRELVSNVIENFYEIRSELDYSEYEPKVREENEDSHKRGG
jgi:hypothetical protein